ncbi:MAG: hypothetical protein AB7Q37_04640 [Pyrinomonadaceae bacterium]
MGGTLILTMILGICLSTTEGVQDYKWERVTSAAPYQQGYNYPVFVLGDKMVALNNGAWLSKDGRNWTKSGLPDSGLNSALLKYVQFDNSIVALGSMTGSYEKFTIYPRILRTRDLEKWEVIGEKSNLPQRIFYSVAVFERKIWMFGGYDGENYHNDVWNSADGVNWSLVTRSAPWSPRIRPVVVVFKGEIWLLGGGVIDGHERKNPSSEKEAWVSRDGKIWRRANPDLKRKWRGTPVVFDDKLWLVGANRGGTFESAVWVTENGSNWTELTAPWSPRGAVAAWVFENKLFMTGGKSSHEKDGDIRFVYSNDVWAMAWKGE